MMTCLILFYPIYKQGQNTGSKSKENTGKVLKQRACKCRTKAHERAPVCPGVQRA